MSVNERIELALAQIVPKIWPLCCPNERPPKEYIVYNPELEESGDKKSPSGSRGCCDRHNYIT